MDVTVDQPGVSKIFEPHYGPYPEYALFPFTPGEDKFVTGTTFTVLIVAALVKIMFNRNFSPENETQAGEFYIDCVGVHPGQQGKGVGSKLFDFLIDEYVHKRNKTLGLLVDKDNPSAKRLYLKLGFEVIGDKTLAGKTMEHLQLKNKNYPS